MKLLTRYQIKRLTDEPNQLSVSLYMPLYNTATDDRHQNPVRYKNLAREAARRLEAWGLTAEQASEFLDRVGILDWSVITDQQRRGLAVFISQGSVRMFATPYEIPEAVFVHNRFYLRPLLPYLSHDGVFYVLTLTENKASFYEATQYSMQKLALEGIPDDFTDEHLHDGTAGHTNYRAVTHDGKNTLVHQKGGVMDDTRIDIEAYLPLINNAVMKHLENENAPMVLIASEDLIDRYRRANSYTNLLEPAIGLNAETLQPKELHDRALHVATIPLQETRNTSFKMFNDLTGTDKQVTDLREILKAADASRIRDFFFRLDLQVWGEFNRETQTVTYQSVSAGNPQSNGSTKADDLADLAAFLTLQRNGFVWASLEEQVPGNHDFAAVLRF